MKIVTIFQQTYLKISRRRLRSLCYYCRYLSYLHLKHNMYIYVVYLFQKLFINIKRQVENDLLFKNM